MQSSKTNKTFHLAGIILLILSLVFPLTLPADEHTLYTAPSVLIGGLPLPEGLILSAIKMKFLGSSMFHPVTKEINYYAVEHQEEVINDLVERELFVREGRKNGIRLDEDEFASFFQKRLDLYGGFEKFKAYLASVYFSMEEYFFPL